MIIMRLTSKISIVLVAVVLMTGILIGILCIENTSSAFDEYLYDTYEVMLNEWARTFVTYYTYNGNSWVGVENLGRFSDLQQSGVVLSDLNGRILYYYDMSYVGKQVPSDIYSRGYILRVDNDVIGILYPAALFSETFMQLEQNFVRSAIAAAGKGVFLLACSLLLLGLGCQ